MNLTGQRNQCPTCGKFFTTNRGFDKHRTGDFGKRPDQRRCMTTEEMVAKGMGLGNDGFWRLKKGHFQHQRA